MISTKLPFYEWLIIVLIFAILGVLIFTTYWRTKVMPSFIPETQTILEMNVTVEGAVKKPGLYVMHYGSTIKDLFERAGGLLAEADFSFKEDVKLKDGQNILVKFKKLITIYVSGAVIEEAVQVPCKITGEELCQVLHLQPTANISKLKKRRRFKDQERLFIPHKKKNKKERKTDL